MTENALRRFFMLWATAALAAASAGVGVMLATARAEGVALAVLPVVLVAVGSLIASNRAVLVYAAFVLCLLGPLPVTDPLPLHAGIQVYPADVLVLLAVASWAVAWLISPEEARPSVPRTHLLGWPLAALRRHVARRCNTGTRALRGEPLQRPAPLASYTPASPLRSATSSRAMPTGGSSWSSMQERSGRWASQSTATPLGRRQRSQAICRPAVSAFLPAARRCSWRERSCSPSSTSSSLARRDVRPYIL